MFRRLRWYWAKKRLALQVPNPAPPSLTVRAKRHTARVEDFPPTVEPYGRLAEHWDQYAAWFALRYDLFLAAAERYYGLRLQSVLDLACGTGLLTRQIAVRVASVVGLEISEPMVRRARSQTSAAH